MQNVHGSYADQLEERLIEFAVRIVRLSSALPNTPAGAHLSNQILRSGTSPAANYGEARGAESKADFAHKLRIVIKELNETKIWLTVLGKAELLPDKKLEPLTEECRELSRIIQATLKSLKTGGKGNSK